MCFVALLWLIGVFSLILTVNVYAFNVSFDIFVENFSCAFGWINKRCDVNVNFFLQ